MRTGLFKNNVNYKLFAYKSDNIFQSYEYATPTAHYT